LWRNKQLPEWELLRKQLVINDSPFVQQNPYLKDCPFDIRDNAVRDFCKALMIQLKAEKRFEMKFRSKKDETSIGLCAKNWKGRGRLFPTKLSGLLKVTNSTPFPDITRDCRLKFTGLKEFFLCVPESPIRREYQGSEEFPKKTVMAIDPGCRTFLTGYDPESQLIVEFGGTPVKPSSRKKKKNDDGDRSLLFRLCHHLDQLQSKKSKETNKRKRRNMTKAWRRASAHVRHLVDDLHRKAAKWMCENYQHILIPPFETKLKTQKRNRKLNNKTVRNMYTWSHYRFLQHLKNKAVEYGDVTIHEVTEDYTSQTCPNCSKLTKTGEKQWRCKHCHFQIDRDWNGARNVFLKNALQCIHKSALQKCAMAASAPPKRSVNMSKCCPSLICNDQ
jgi:putative transposase